MDEPLATVCFRKTDQAERYDVVVNGVVNGAVSKVKGLRQSGWRYYRDGVPNPMMSNTRREATEWLLATTGLLGRFDAKYAAKAARNETPAQRAAAERAAVEFVEQPVTVKYPHVEVELSNQDGNAVGMIGRTMKALRRAGVPADEVSAFATEARSGGYDNVLQTIMRWVETS